jgi:hypothetical protein
MTAFLFVAIWLWFWPTFVSHVVDFVEDHPAHFAQHLGAPVEHGTQNLGGHHHTGGVGVQRHVAGHLAMNNIQINLKLKFG